MASHPLGGAPHVLTEAGALTHMSQQGCILSLQLFGKEPEKIVSPFLFQVFSGCAGITPGLP